MSAPSQPAPVAYSYQRLSCSAQLKGGGLDRQQADAIRWCEENGYVLDTELELIDRGRSAYKGHHLQRGFLGQLIAEAERGTLGRDWVLLIEAVDRLSRLEPLDALSDVFLRLVRDCGCRIIDLEDRQEYSRATLNSDPIAMVKLALKCQAAHDYSKRLSRRLTVHWDQTKAGFRDGTKAFRGGENSKGGRHPFWLVINEARDGWVFNEKADTVRLMFQLLLENGISVVAKQLNERGHTTRTGKPWQSSGVQRTASDPAAMGTLRLGVLEFNKTREAHYRWSMARAEAEELGIPFTDQEPPQPDPATQLEEFPGHYPAVVTPEQWAEVNRCMQERKHAPAAKANRRAGIGHTFLQGGLVRCTQGNVMGVTLSRPQRAAPRYYFRCRFRLDGKRCQCEGVGWLKDDLEAHVLGRLDRHIVGEAALPGGDGGGEIEAAQARLRERQAIANTARDSVAKAQEKFEWAMDNGTPDFAENASNLLEKRRAALRSAEAALATAVDELQRVKRRAEAETTLEGDPARELLRAVHAGVETMEQRKQLHQALISRRLTVMVDATNPDRRLVGMAFGDEEPEWKRLNAAAYRTAMMLGAVQPAVIHESDDGNVVVMGQGALSPVTRALLLEHGIQL